MFGIGGRHLGPVLGMALLATGLSASGGHAETYYFMEQPRLGLGLSYESETDIMKGPQGTARSNSRTMKERLEMEAKGWAYHPTLMTYAVKLTPQWEQQREQSGPAEAERQTFLQGYDMSATFLQYKPYTLTIFTRKNTSAVKTAFAGRLTTDLDLYGANLLLRYKVLPTTLSYSHSLASATGFYTSREEKDYAYLVMGHREKNNDTNLTASYALTSREAALFHQNTKSFNEHLYNAWSVTPDRRITLNSSQTHRSFEGGLTRSSGFGAAESLHWQHRQNLSSGYHVSYLRDAYNEFSSETKSAGADLTHVLYENLTSSLAADASRRDSSGGSEKTRGGSLGFDYRRSIPRGMITLSAGNGYAITNSDIRQVFTQVVDEAHVLNESDLSLLDNKLVDSGSITVTDSEHAIIYTKDVDYRIDEVGEFLRISRTIFGAVGDGQQVLVSYRYLSNPAADYATRSYSHGGSLSLWSTLRIYYRFARSKQEFLSDRYAGAPSDSTTRVAGADITREWKWSTSRMLYEDAYSSSGTSYRKWLAQEALKFRPTNRTSLGVAGNYARTLLRESDQTDTSYGVSAHFQWMATGWSNFRNDVFWNAHTAHAVDSGFSSLFEWYYGIWRGTMSYRFIDTRDRISGQSRRNHIVFLDIARMMF